MLSGDDDGGDDGDDDGRSWYKHLWKVHILSSLESTLKQRQIFLPIQMPTL